MVGQTKILKWFDAANKLNAIPRFLILIGGRGSGKRMLAKHFALSLGAIYAESGIKAEEVRDVVKAAYTITDTTLYCIPDSDLMRAEAKNALLKVTEEPPKNAFFILTCCDSGSILDTLSSRANVIRMEAYTKSELKQYCREKFVNSSITEDVIDSAITPYEIDTLQKYGAEFFDYVDLVVDNIAEVEPANAFKSGSKLALKNEEDKYDLLIFFSRFIRVCAARFSQDPTGYSNAIVVTSKYYGKATKLGCNKGQIYDMWVFEIREALYRDDK